MSEEETKAAAAPAEGKPAANGEGKKNGGKDRKQQPRDETPIEELYDLSKPIPKVRLLSCREVIFVDFGGLVSSRGRKMTPVVDGGSALLLGRSFNAYVNSRSGNDLI